MEFLFVAFLICIPLSLFEAYRFIRFDGNMKRGIKIGTDFLSFEIVEKLRSLKSDIVEEDTKAFIRKENQVVLIQPISHLFHRNLGFWYIGLVDLSARRPRIAFYTPFSAIIIVTILLITAANELYTGSSDNMFGAACGLTLIPIFYLIAHPFSKNVVLKYVEKTLQTKSG
jgi:hypothetical protein